MGGKLVHRKGTRKVYLTDNDVYVASVGGYWIPGTWKTKNEAVKAASEYASTFGNLL